MSFIHDHQSGTGTQANPAVAVTITLGFKPGLIKVCNAAGDEMVHYQNQGDGVAIERNATGPAITVIADGPTATATGFTLPETSEVMKDVGTAYHWEAWRESM